MSFFKIEKYQFIDLFSGCGGFSAGLEKAGHQCRLGVDFDKDAIATFAHNHPHAKTFLGDIHELSAQKLKNLIDIHKIDMVIGGPPCQGFSTVGRGKSDDSRNSLFLEFVRIVKLVKPKVIIMENVTGLVAKKNRHILDAIFSEFTKLGFHMDARILSAEEYGVPEKRRRTIIMGVRSCESFPFPQITHGPRGTKKIETVATAFKNLKSSQGKIFNHDKEAATPKNKLELKRLSYIPEGKGIRYQEDELSYLPKKLRLGLDWQKLRENRLRQTKYQRLDRKKPAPTILTARTAYYHPKEDRYLTAREAAACQSFDNDFVFHGAQTSQFRQIGNAVAPKLAQAIGEALKNLKFNSQATSKKINKNTEFYKKAFTYQDHTML